MRRTEGFPGRHNNNHIAERLRSGATESYEIGRIIHWTDEIFGGNFQRLRRRLGSLVGAAHFHYDGMRFLMNGNRMCALVVAASAFLSAAPLASAADYDGGWNMTAVTTRGHCGTIPIGMGVSGRRIYSTGGSFAFYPIRLGGSVSRSGNISLKAVAGPRVAHGSGRLTPTSGRGTWRGRGPSGLCSGVWTATR